MVRSDVTHEDVRRVSMFFLRICGEDVPDYRSSFHSAISMSSAAIRFVETRGCVESCLEECWQRLTSTPLSGSVHPPKKPPSQRQNAVFP
jgi:hypothetical protein